MFEITFEGDGNNFHIVMRMCSKSSCCGDFIIVEYAEYTEVHPFRIVVVGKTKGMLTMQPAMIGIASGGGTMQNAITHDFGFCVWYMIKAHVSMVSSRWAFENLPVARK